MSFDVERGASLAAIKTIEERDVRPAKLPKRPFFRAFCASFCVRVAALLASLLAANAAFAVPFFTSLPVTAVNEDTAYRYDIRTADFQSGNRRVSATVLPAWLTLADVSNSGTARLAGTPTQAQVGTHAVSLTVTNLSTNATAVQSFAITVAHVNDAPVITGQTPNPIPLARGASLTIVLSHLIVSDPDNTYPTGFTLTVLNGSNYTRSGNTITPSANFTGTLGVGVRVNDGRDNSNTFNVQVSVAPPNRPPEIVTPIPDQRGTENAPFQLSNAVGAPVTLAAFFRDPDAGDTLTYQVTGLPPSGNLVANAATGAITGTPRIADARDTPYVVVVTANDGKTAAGSQPRLTFNLTIAALDRSDLSLGISLAPAPALINSAVAWTFTITNRGPRPSTSGELKADLLGNRFSFTELSGCLVVAAGEGQQMTCTLPTIAVGANAAITVRGAAAQSGDLLVSANATGSASAPPDPDPSNNRATATLHVAEVLTEPLQSLTSPATQGSASGDVDGDGYADLALANGGGQGVQVHLNVVDPANERRRRLDERSTAVGDTPAADVALADLDNDQDLDLVIANNTGQSNTVFLNNRTTFDLSAAVSGGKSNAVAVADFDADGALDLAFANTGPATVYLKRAATYVQSAQLGNDDNRQVIAVDLDLDNLPDLVFASPKGPSRFYRNLGAGTFAAGVVIDADGAESVASGDFNGDRRPDLVFARLAAATGAPTNPVYQNNAATGGQQFVRVTSLGAAPTVDVLATDVNADGTIDVIAINSTGTHQVYRGDGTGRFSLHPMQLATAGAVGAALGRFSSDTRVDLVVASAKSTGVFINDGRGGLGKGDVTLPTIQLLGDAKLTVPVGEAYKDPGATATDDLDGNLTSSIVTRNDVDTAVIGSYVVTYNVVDSSGNAATQMTRDVNVAARDETSGGGGSGAAGDLALALAVLLYFLRLRRRQSGSP